MQHLTRYSLSMTYMNDFAIWCNYFGGSMCVWCMHDFLRNRQQQTNPLNADGKYNHTLSIPSTRWQTFTPFTHTRHFLHTYVEFVRWPNMCKRRPVARKTCETVKLCLDQWKHSKNNRTRGPDFCKLIRGDLDMHQSELCITLKWANKGFQLTKR